MDILLHNFDLQIRFNNVHKKFLRIRRFIIPSRLSNIMSSVFFMSEFHCFGNFSFIFFTTFSTKPIINYFTVLQLFMTSFQYSLSRGSVNLVFPLVHGILPINLQKKNIKLLGNPRSLNLETRKKEATELTIASFQDRKLSSFS